MPKYDVTVKLIGEDGNAWNVIGLVGKALKAAGADQTEVDAFRTEAISGDYNHLIQTTLKWVKIV